MHRANYYYLSILLGSVLVAFYKVIMVNAGTYDREMKLLPRFLLAFVSVNFAFELIAIFVVREGDYNHFVYALCMMVHSMVLVGFYSLIVQGKRMYALALLVVVTEVSFVIRFRYWQPQVLMPTSVVAGHFALIALATIAFLGRCLKLENTLSLTIAFRLGCVVLCYFTLAMIVVSVGFSEKLSGINYFYSRLMVNVLNIAFYTALIVVAFTIPNKRIAHGS